MSAEFGQFAFNAFGLSLTADGIVALWLALPLTVLIIALAYRVGRPKL